MPELIQFMEPTRDWAEAIVLLHGLSRQLDYRGGRVLPSVGGHPWTVQAFFEDMPVINTSSAPMTVIMGLVENV